ncbi:Alpha/Beta hydrolase protein [Schizophyllum fasciatum]
MSRSSSERLTIPASPGIQLEAILSSPSSSSSATSNTSGNKVAVCLHPWSWLGGRMADPVVGAVEGVLIGKGYHVIRYNSRGVGRSTGRVSSTGMAEGEDLEGVVRWALQRIPNIDTVTIAGYSHGALIASLHPVLPPPITMNHILISYPLGPRGWLTLFKSAHYAARLSDLIQNPRARVLVVHGDGDEFTSAASYRDWAAELRMAADSGGRSDEGPGEAAARLVISSCPRASHFWHGDSENALEEEISKFLS